MKKKMLSFIVAAGILCTTPAFAQVSSDSPIDVYLQGSCLHSNDVTYETYEIKDNRTFLPIRLISEKLGYQVDWHQDTQAVILSKDGKQLEMTIGEKDYKANGENKNMDIAPYLSNNRTYIPVRFLEQAMNEKVMWDAKERMVLIGEVSHESALDEKDRQQLQGGFGSIIIPENIGLEKDEFGTLVFYVKEIRVIDSKVPAVLFRLTKNERPITNHVPGYILNYENGIYTAAAFTSDVQIDPSSEKQKELYRKALASAEEMVKSYRVK